jgi:hypothetical protein
METKMSINSHSKAGQDIFAHRLVPGGGTFLDIGSNHPTVINNTFALEQLGWGGLLLDNDEYCRQISHIRKAPFIFGDVTKTDWFAVLRDHDLSGEPIDYVSLDVDSATLSTLENLLKYKVRFRCATIEHDSYRFGPGPRDEMRRMLDEAGYRLLCKDVHDDGVPFEDWWVDWETMNTPAAEKMRCEGLDWKAIV